MGLFATPLAKRIFLPLLFAALVSAGCSRTANSTTAPGLTAGRLTAVQNAPGAEPLALTATIELAPPAEEGPILQLPGLSGSIGHRARLHKVKDDLYLSASAALVIDQDTGRVLLHRNEDAVLPIASLTKLMTALVVTETGLPMAEIISIADDNVDGERHSQAMNSKARALGMKSTTYVEPTGLSTSNQSTARDLARLVDTASKNRLVKNPHWDIELQKTGYIVEAGWCMVLDTKIAGRKLVMVLLDAGGAVSRIADAERIRRVLSSPSKVVSDSAADPLQPHG